MHYYESMECNYRGGALCLNPSPSLRPPPFPEVAPPYAIFPCHQWVAHGRHAPRDELFRRGTRLGSRPSILEIGFPSTHAFYRGVYKAAFGEDISMISGTRCKTKGAAWFLILLYRRGALETNSSLAGKGL